MDLKHFFKQLIDKIGESVSQKEILIWFSDIKIDRLDGATLFLKTTSHFRKEKLEDRYFSIILTACREINPAVEGIKISLESDLSPSNSKEVKFATQTTHEKDQPIDDQSSTHHHSLGRDNVLQENRFERFVVTDENELAYKFAQKSILKLGEINPIFIYGRIGTGKTHLIQSVYNQLTEEFPFLKVKYLQPDDFVGEYTRALKTRADRQFRLRYRTLDVLLIDDIQFFMGKEKSAQEFFHIFNHIYMPGKQMIFCSDRNPEELDHLDDRLKSRLASSAILEMKSPSQASRQKIIDFLVKEKKLPIDRSVGRYLAENLPGDVRKIVGAIKHLTILNSIYQMPITIDYCKKHIKQLKLRKNKDGNYCPEDIMEIFCKRTSVDLKDIQSGKKNKAISGSRQIAMYLLKQLTQLSLKEIGGFLGNRTAASVSQSYHKIAKELVENKHTQKVVNLVLEEI